MILNFGREQAHFSLPDDVACSGQELLIGHYPADGHPADGHPGGGAAVDLRRLALRPYEACVYRLH